MNPSEEACICLLQEETKHVTSTLTALSKRADLLEILSGCSADIIVLFDNILETAKKELRGNLLRNYVRVVRNKNVDRVEKAIPPSIASKVLVGVIKNVCNLLLSVYCVTLALTGHLGWIFLEQ